MREFNLEEIKKSLEYIVDGYKDIETTDIKEVGRIIDRIMLDFDTCQISPNIILTRALYLDDSEEKFYKGKFAIRPTIKYLLDIKDMKYSFVLINSKSFFELFVKNIIDWVAEYTLYAVMQQNLDKLNNYIMDILNNIDFPYTIKFSLGEGITDISDDFIELGLNSDTILNIDKLGFFVGDEFWRERYTEKFINILKECNRPYDIVKVKSEITKDLGIYNRKSINKLLRKFVSRRIDFVRVGVGYAEDENTFALIEKIAVTPEDVENYDIDEIILTDNEIPTSMEKKKGLTKIVTKYKLMPFEKKTNILVDIGLKEYLRNISESEGVKI